LVNAVVDQCVVFDQTMQRIVMELLNQMDGGD
jgi:ATP-dependent 26S proteasome regulatory subunit